MNPGDDSITGLQALLTVVGRDDRKAIKKAIGAAATSFLYFIHGQ